MQGTSQPRFGVLGWGWSASLRAPATKLSHDPAMATCVPLGALTPNGLNHPKAEFQHAYHHKIQNGSKIQEKLQFDLLPGLDSIPPGMGQRRTFGWWRGCTWQQLVGSVGPLNKIGIPKSTCKKTKTW